MSNFLFRYDTADWGTFGFMLLIAGALYYSESSGRLQLAYGKFRQGGKLSTRTAMLIIYTPALIVYILGFMANMGLNTVYTAYHILLLIAVAGHFLKRDLEVLFVHRYSRTMGWRTTVFIALLYFLVSFIAHSEHQIKTPRLLGESLSGPALYFGFAVYLISQAMNFYHHLILRKLRKDPTDAGYRIPNRGLFRYVTCPHYLFEITAWAGIALMSRSLAMWGVFWIMAGYLAGRSRQTYKWYRDNVPDYPESRRALIPGIL